MKQIKNIFCNLSQTLGIHLNSYINLCNKFEYFEKMAIKCFFNEIVNFDYLNFNVRLLNICVLSDK